MMTYDKVLTPYEQIIRDLSDRIVEAQKPIRILNSLKWDNHVQHYFFQHKFKKLPPVDSQYYQRNSLNFDPEKKTAEFYAIELDIRRKLGQFSGIGRIMRRMCREYREVIRMLLARGNAEFSKISQDLYGSSNDAFYAGAPTLKDLAILVSETLSRLKESNSNSEVEPVEIKKIKSEEAIKILSTRLNHYFNPHGKKKGGRRINVILSDDILADAAAGADTIRIRKGSEFSERDLKIFEVHEGWVHIATTLNGMAQPICTFLSKGPPSSTVNQEGLAIIMEIFTFSSYPHRVQRLTDRITAIHMAEQGADFIDVFKFYCNQGLSELESYSNARRVFRGSTPTQGPFTKDLSYSKGFILIYNYIRIAVQKGLQGYIPLLFLGKTTLEDLHIFADLMEAGVIIPPIYLPPQFKDLSALSAWMSYSLFLNTLSLEYLSTDYKMFLHD
jgi:uncharacterized protein (TIGR02421 family)